jgi:ADP-ribose pyrophosphatase YjhB (NUDIX family)
LLKLRDLLFEGHENDSNDTGGVLYYCYDKVLLCLGEHSGKWHIPKGHIRIGEDSLVGSVREFTEETQIVLNGIPELVNTYKKDNGGEFYLYVLKGTRKFIPRINHEHTDWGYFDIINLPSPINKWTKETIENE